MRGPFSTTNIQKGPLGKENLKKRRMSSLEKQFKTLDLEVIWWNSKEMTF